MDGLSTSIGFTWTVEVFFEIISCILKRTHKVPYDIAQALVLAAFSFHMLNVCIGFEERRRA